MGVALRCNRCGQTCWDHGVVQTNYGLSRRPRHAVICGQCSRQGEAEEAPRRFRAQMEQVVVMDVAAREAGMPVERRDAMFRSSGLSAAFEALMTEVA